MFPFSINNAIKLFQSNNQECIDEDAIKERVSEAVMQSLPNKMNVKFNAIIVLECDNEQKRTIVMNETINSNVFNGQRSQFTTTFPMNSFPTISTSDCTNPSNMVLSQQSIFPATMEGLQALLNLTSASMNHSNISENNFSFIPVKTERNDSNVKNGTVLSSRKRKSEKPCRIPQDPVSDSHGLDLSVGGRYGVDVKQEKASDSSNSLVPIWRCQPSIQGRPLHSGTQPMLLPRPKKPTQLPGQKKSCKIFNCNQCKLQFNSLSSLCKHTFSDHRAFRCTFCSANFTQRSNLQRHSLKHVGFKPFICNVCSKAYYRKDHLVRHIEVSHPGSDPKSNITVKLSSSECLEYLEKMQSDQLEQMSMIAAVNEANFPSEITATEDEISSLVKLEARLCDETVSL